MLARMKGLFKPRNDAAPAQRDLLREALEAQTRRERATTGEPERPGAAASTDESRTSTPNPLEALAVRDPFASDLAPHGVSAMAEAAAATAGPGQKIPVEFTTGIDPRALRLLTPQLAHELRALPIRIEGSRVVVAVDKTPTRGKQHQIAFIASMADRPRQVTFHQVPQSLLEGALDVYYPLWSAGTQLIPSSHDVVRLFMDSAAQTNVPVLRPADLTTLSVRNLVRGLLMKAIHRGAADVLFEPAETEFRVRYKVEGECELACTPMPPSAGPQVISVIKQLAEMDIAERAKCQEGSFEMQVEVRPNVIKRMRFRVAITPVEHGEDCTIRCHDNSEQRIRLDSLGADPRTLGFFERVRDTKRGFIIFAGTTGSGKTTSLTALLSERDALRERIITIEDPVEIKLPYIAQTSINEKKGETFAVMLRNALRRAPDVILVGEIRDAETAEIAVKGALTGHQILSTIHCDTAPQAVTRLLNEGIVPFNLASCLTGVVAQKLLNRLCDHCARPVEYDPELLLGEQFAPFELGSIRAREAVGCALCRDKGTNGRIPIYETMEIDEELKAIISASKPGYEPALALAAVQKGMRPLRRQGLDLVRSGHVALSQVAGLPRIPTEALESVWSRVSPIVPREDFRFDPNATGEWAYVRTPSLGDGTPDEEQMEHGAQDGRGVPADLLVENVPIDRVTDRPAPRTPDEPADRTPDTVHEPVQEIERYDWIRAVDDDFEETCDAIESADRTVGEFDVACSPATTTAAHPEIVLACEPLAGHASDATADGLGRPAAPWPLLSTGEDAAPIRVEASDAGFDDSPESGDWPEMVAIESDTPAMPANDIDRLTANLAIAKAARAESAQQRPAPPASPWAKRLRV